MYILSNKINFLNPFVWESRYYSLNFFLNHSSYFHNIPSNKYFITLSLQLIDNTLTNVIIKF